MKHNKKRNTAFVYEILVREITQAIIDKSADRKAKIVSLVKEHFEGRRFMSRSTKRPFSRRSQNLLLPSIRSWDKKCGKPLCPTLNL